ncbi:MAG TPA: SPFH domain-containing protein [Kofleriaceae bacterium]
MITTTWIVLAAVAIVLVYMFGGIRVVQPTSRGLVERFGKYRRVAEPGFHWIIPVAERLLLVNVTDVMMKRRTATSRATPSCSAG